MLSLMDFVVIWYGTSRWPLVIVVVVVLIIGGVRHLRQVDQWKGKKGHTRSTIVSQYPSYPELIITIDQTN